MTRRTYCWILQCIYQPKESRLQAQVPGGLLASAGRKAMSLLGFHCACVYSVLSMLACDTIFLFILMILKSLLIIYTLPWREKLKQKKEKVDIGKTIRKTWNNWGLGHISLIRETKIQDLRLYTSPVNPLGSVTLNKPITLPGSWVLLSLKWMDQKTNSLPALKHVEYLKDANKTS